MIKTALPTPGVTLGIMDLLMVMKKQKRIGGGFIRVIDGTLAEHSQLQAGQDFRRQFTEDVNSHLMPALDDTEYDRNLFLMFQVLLRAEVYKIEPCL